VVVNERCVVQTRDGFRVVVCAGVPLLHFTVDDRMAQALAVVSLVEQGWATQLETAAAFGLTTRTVRRYQERIARGGLAALGRRGGYPAGRPRQRASRTRLIQRLKAEGVSNRTIAARAGITEKAVRKVLRRLGWKPEPPQPQALLPLAGADADPNLSAPPAPAARSSKEEGLGEAESGMGGAAAGADPNLSAPPAPAARSSKEEGLGEAESGMGGAAAGADPNLSAPPAPAARSSKEEGPGEAESGTGGAVAGADPNLSALPDEECPVTVDEDPADRRGDRLLAYLGLLDDAAPLFASTSKLPRAGVLLAIPGLLGTGVLECARSVFGDIGPAFYGLRTSVVAFVLMALLRIKRPEGLKEQSPEDLGRLLGLDRAPEVKTLRRKLARLASHGRAAAFGRALALRRVAAHGPAMGFLYVDGHVRVYHGKHTLPKTHIARMRICAPATSDYWVNDVHGEPLFLVTAEANAGLVHMLPSMLGEVRSLVGERRVTVVFDRGGWSPALFQALIDQGFDILTYRKGTSRRVPLRLFRKETAVIEGREVAYTLADQGILLLKGKLRLRQVTRLTDTGHQTPIITSRRDLLAAEVAFRMFERWKQENFFKYLREEYALDALLQHAVEEDDATREVPNPRHKELTAQIRRAQTEATWIASRYGFQALGNSEQQRRTMRGFKIANAADGRALKLALDRVQRLRAHRARVPRRVPVGDVVPGTVVKLAAERQHLSSLFKMVAYQAEGDLLNRLRPHYHRAEEEGRTLVQTALSSAADIEVTPTELRVTLAPLSSPHRTRAIAMLCNELNANPVNFPGTSLRMAFSVAERGANRTNR
jgi:prepilin-type processing-associated H-X9-DG protein